LNRHAPASKQPVRALEDIMHALLLNGNNWIRGFMPSLTGFWQMPPWGEKALWFGAGFITAFLLLFVWALMEAHGVPGVWVKFLP
jgi:hypothetical protein